MAELDLKTGIKAASMWGNFACLFCLSFFSQKGYAAFEGQWTSETVWVTLSWRREEGQEEKMTAIVIEMAGHVSSASSVCCLQMLRYRSPQLQCCRRREWCMRRRLLCMVDFQRGLFHQLVRVAASVARETVDLGFCVVEEDQPTEGV